MSITWITAEDEQRFGVLSRLELGGGVPVFPLSPLAGPRQPPTARGLFN